MECPLSHRANPYSCKLFHRNCHPTVPHLRWNVLVNDVLAWATLVCTFGGLSDAKSWPGRQWLTSDTSTRRLRRLRGSLKSCLRKHLAG